MCEGPGIDRNPMAVESRTYRVHELQCQNDAGLLVLNLPLDNAAG